MARPVVDADFTCTLTVNIPFPTQRLAQTALRTLAVDEELSPLVRRSFSLTATSALQGDSGPGDKTVLTTEYKAATDRMLRVAVNGFFDNVGVIVQVMEELDVDALHEKGLQDLEGAQGVEHGMTGTTLTGA